MASAKMELVDKLFQAFDDVSCKRQETRINAYGTMCEIWKHHYIPASLANRKMALMELLERSLRKGKEKEQIMAADVIGLLAVQSESVEDVTEMVQRLRPVLMSIVKDSKLIFSNVRAHCCTALGVLCFVGEDNPEEILSLMKLFQDVLQNSNLRSDENGAFYTKVMNVWSLLLTLLTPKSIVEHESNGILLSARYHIEMLESTHLAVRTVTGKTLALLHELGLQHDPNFLHDELPDLIVIIQKLSTDAFRFQAKENRKLQRSTFREVLHYLQEHVTPKICIKFADETLLLDSWAIQQQYTCLRNVFGTGMNVHLRENLLVRDILNLLPKMDSMEKDSGKIVKLEQQFRWAVAAKKRSKERGLERDKRSLSAGCKSLE